MTALWLPGYEHRPVVGAGLSVGAGRPKVGSHTTETGPGSFDALERHWRSNWGSGLPHFLQEGRRIVQFLALNVGAYTAKNRPGGADINRSGPMIQIETIARAADGWDDETYEGFGIWLADLSKHVDFDIGTYPRFYGANEGIVLAREDSPIRLSAREFEAFNGWLGHQHLPENDHWDPGGIDAIRVERIARAHLAGGQPAIPDIPEPEADVPATIEQNKNANQIWITSGDTKRYVMEVSKDGVPYEAFIEAAKARGYVDNRERDDGAAFLSQLRDISDPVVSPT